jgi:hypothetical protein
MLRKQFSELQRYAYGNFAFDLFQRAVDATHPTPVAGRIGGSNVSPRVCRRHAGLVPGARGAASRLTTS